jgi:serine/threonine-protein kinase
MQVGQKLGPYAIEKELGGGAMGTVYLARDTDTNTAVAIKIIAGGHESNSTSVDRFKRETQILKKLNHPNIVRLHTSGRVKGGGPFYVMEYIDGESLEKTLQRRGRFTWEEVVSLGQQVCAALQHAHEQGIIHRDLKPANIMMTPDGTAKLTDFGIAKGLELSQLTATNCTVGTASYMAPEQCRGEKNLTPKADLYSLGVVFYELLTGRLPFQADNTLDMFLAHTEGKFERPSRLVLDIPIWLDTLVCQLLEKDPEKRPLDAAMVARSLGEIADKVAAQRSAGVDVVSARKIDLPRKLRLRDEADREAARALKEAATRTKTKRRRRPIYERGWFLTVAVAAVLGVMAWFTWHFFLRPPSPEKLYTNAHVLMEANRTDEARDGPIKEFLALYKDRNDAQAAEIHAWADRIDMDVRELQLRKIMKLDRPAEDEAEQAAFAAVHAEEAGEWTQARAHWHALDQYKDIKDYQDSKAVDLHAWSLVADKRLREIQEAEDLGKQLQTRLLQLRTQEPEIKFGASQDGQALRATLAEMFGDFAVALDGWQGLKTTPQHVWVLLATKKVHDLRPDAPRGPAEKKARHELIQQKLAEAATDIEMGKQFEARTICRDLIALYATNSDPEITAAVAKARRLLKELATKAR